MAVGRLRQEQAGLLRTLELNARPKTLVDLDPPGSLSSHVRDEDCGNELPLAFWLRCGKKCLSYMPQIPDNFVALEDLRNIALQPRNNRSTPETGVFSYRLRYVIVMTAQQGGHGFLKRTQALFSK